MISKVENFSQHHMEPVRNWLMEVYPHKPFLADEAYLRWQFLNEIEGPKRNLKLLFREGRLVGHYGSVCAPIYFEGEVSEGVFPLLWYVDPAFRGMGSIQLYQEIVSTGKVRVFLDCKPDSVAIFKKRGFLEQSIMPRWVAILNEEACSKILKSYPKSYIAETTALDFEKWADSRRALNQVLDSKISKSLSKGLMTFVGPEIQEFLNRERKKGRLPLQDQSELFGIIKEPPYLNWRYSNYPKSQYKLICIEGTRAAYSWAIYRTEKVSTTPYSALRIVEWAVNQEDESTFVSHLVNENKDCAFIDFFNSAEKKGLSLESLGFLRNRTGINLPAYLLQPPYPAPGYVNYLSVTSSKASGAKELGAQNFEQWSFSKGDSDLDRPIW